MDPVTGGVGRRDMLKTGALGVGALAGMSAVAASASSASAAAAIPLAISGDMFLKIGDIPGDSVDSKHTNEIHIESFSWGVSGPSSSTSTKLKDVQFSARVGKHTPLLAKACATGQHFKKATLTVRKAGGEQVDYYRLTVENVQVSSYQAAGAVGGDPIEEFSLDYGRFVYSYAPQNPDGSLADPIVVVFPPR